MFDEDLSLFFSDADFARTVLIDGKKANVIFSNETVIDNQVLTTSPHLVVMDEVVTELEVEKGSEVEVNNIGYEVATIEPDGTGISTIFLKKKFKN